MLTNERINKQPQLGYNGALGAPVGNAPGGIKWSRAG